MESKALERLEMSVQRLLDEHGRAHTRQQQLAAALAKGRDELDKLEAENHRHKAERANARKRIDSVVKRLDALAAGADGEEP